MTDRNRVGMYARVLGGSSMEGQRLPVVKDHDERGVSLMMPGVGKVPARPGYFANHEFVLEVD